jgi:hypothetical protein
MSLQKEKKKKQTQRNIHTGHHVKAETRKGNL